MANRLHMVTGDISVFTAFGVNGAYYNSDLAKEHGLDCVYELVRRGAWTWDRCVQMSRAVANDLDGDGIMGANDLFGVTGEHATMRMIVFGVGERFTRKDENDIPYLAINSPRTIRALDYALESFLHPGHGMYANDWTAGWDGHHYMRFLFPKFDNNEMLFIFFPVVAALDLRDMQYDFGIVPYPKLDENQERYYAPASRWYDTFLFVPSTNQDFTRTGTILEALGYYSQTHVRPAVIERTVTGRLMRDADAEEMFNIMLGNRVFDLGEVYLWGGINSNLLYHVANNRNNTFASQYEAHSALITAAMQRTIDAMLN
jgi:hypothetical protein